MYKLVAEWRHWTGWMVNVNGMDERPLDKLKYIWFTERGLEDRLIWALNSLLKLNKPNVYSDTINVCFCCLNVNLLLLVMSQACVTNCPCVDWCLLFSWNFDVSHYFKLFLDACTIFFFNKLKANKTICVAKFRVHLELNRIHQQNFICQPQYMRAYLSL